MEEGSGQGRRWLRKKKEENKAGLGLAQGA